MKLQPKSGFIFFIISCLAFFNFVSIVFAQAGNVIVEDAHLEENALEEPTTQGPPEEHRTQEPLAQILSENPSEQRAPAMIMESKTPTITVTSKTQEQSGEEKTPVEITGD